MNILHQYPSVKWIAVSVLILPVLIFWIWVMKEAIRTSQECPTDCWCYEGSTFVFCTNTSIKHLPLDIRSSLESFVITKTDIPVLTKNYFLNLNITTLDMLHMETAGIFTIEPGAFNGLQNMTSLNLGTNNISSIQLGTFSNLENLKVLTLSMNQIKYLKPGVFKGLKNLTHLDLDENELQDLQSDLFTDVSNITYLSLEENKLTRLDPDILRFLTKLRVLILNSNKNLIVPTETRFLNIPTLETMQLRDCKIKTLSETTFENLSNISKLFLSNNSLTTLDIGVVQHLSHLERMDLAFNPLKCDCQLKKVWKWCKDHHIEVDTYNFLTKCKTPQEVYDLWWGVLGNSQCIDGRITFEGNYRSLVPELDTEYKEYERLEHFITYTESAIYGLIFLVGAIGNIVVMVIIGSNKRMRTIPNAYIFNLAVADLLLLIMNLPFAHAMRLSPYWELGEFLCKTVFFFRKLSIGVSAFSVTILSIQRYYATYGSTSLSTKNSTIILILVVWITAFCCALPSVFTDHMEEDVYCSSAFSNSFHMLSLSFNLLVFCIIPLIIIVFTNMMTVRTLMKTADNSGNELRTSKTMMRIVTALSFIFAVSFVPYHILLLIVSSREYFYEINDLYLIFVSICFLALNACLNPIALYITSLTFRKLFKSYILCCFKSSKPDNDDDEDILVANEAAVHYRAEPANEVNN